MKAARWHGQKDVRVENVEEPVPSKGEVVVEVKRVGICGTDLHEYTTGPHQIPVDKPNPITGHQAPIIMGHEIAGKVVEVGPEVEDWKTGDRVAVMPLQSCGKCYYCIRGWRHLCQNYAGTGLAWYWGGFAEYAMLKDYQLREIPKSMSYKEAACIEPYALAAYSVNRGKLSAGDNVLITGGGPTAVLTLMACKAAGAYRVYMTEVQPGRLRRLKEMGATEAFNPLECNLEKEIMARTDGLGVDIAIDCSGIESAINDCFKLLRKRGTYVQSGLTVKKISVDPYEWAYKDLNMFGVWCYYTYDFPKIINLIKEGKFPVENIVTSTIKIEDIVEKGFKILTEDKEGKELKIQVSFE
jgi:(R,R)-butanediol dehydrogenase / meso-butanediol dehydrogenase / diacetyl reductase